MLSWLLLNLKSPSLWGACSNAFLMFSEQGLQDHLISSVSAILERKDNWGLVQCYSIQCFVHQKSMMISVVPLLSLQSYIYVYYMSYMYVWLWWWTINTAYILHIQYMSLHSRTTRLNLKMMASKRILLFQGLIFRFHVKLQGCTQRLSVPFIQQNIVSSRIVWLTHVLNQAKLRTAGLKPLTTLFHTFPGFSVS